MFLFIVIIFILTINYTQQYKLGYLCPDLNPTPHLVDPTNLGKHRLHDTVTFRCAVGYILSGSKSATCKYVNPAANMGSWNATPPNCIDCRKSLTDLHYKGHINTTISGHACRYWKEMKYYRTEEENYCRTPPNDTDNAGGPWCYSSAGSWERCNVPVCEDCRNSTTDRQYKGHINTTRKGYTCIYWKDATKYSAEEQNYCRTPPDDGDNDGGPWCYTSNSGDWDRCNVPVCGGKTCPNLTNNLIPKDGKSIYHYGETVSVSCGTGMLLKGDRIISCDQSGQWNATLPTCEEITCTRISLNLTEGMNVMKNTDRYNYREMVTMSCKSGFTGTPVASQCIDVNKWSHKSPTCTKKTCSRASLHLSQNVNVRNDKPSYDYNEEVSMSCNTGFTGNTVIARCTDVNKWSKYSPTCTRITCTQRSLHLTPNVTVTNDKHSYDFNEAVTMSCNTGFSGRTVIAQCTEVDTWSTNSPTCKKITCTQASLHLTQNANVTNNKQSYDFNEKVTMSCNTGFSGRTVAARCIDVNIWSEYSPTCTMASCPKLNLTPHMSQPRKLDGYHHKDEIHFGCDVGYYLVGSQVLSCLANGKWSSQQPTCKAASCPVLPKLPQLHHIPDLSEYIYNDTVTFQCDVGFLLTGPALITCTTNNRQSPVYWNDKQPNCTAVACPGLYEGYSIQWSPNLTTYSYNDIVHFQCNAGYQLSGPSSLVCQANDHEYIGHWSKKQPACVVTEEYKGVSYMVFGVVVALIIVTVGIIIGLMCFIRIKLKDSSKQYEDIKINMDQLRNHNEDQIYSELSDTQ